jgi:hypothetical protein
MFICLVKGDTKNLVIGKVDAGSKSLGKLEQNV